jgi:hypothetical protein
MLPADPSDIEIYYDGYRTAGGAVYIQESTVDFENCNFESNTANWGGGAVYLDHQSDGNFVNSEFKNNFARYQGGAVSINGGSALHFARCLFSRNLVSGWNGGGYGGAVHIARSTTFRVWTGGADPETGGWDLTQGTHSNAAFFDCNFFSNQAAYGGRGGAVHVEGPSEASFTETAFSGNHIDDGGYENQGDYDLYCRVLVGCSHAAGNAEYCAGPCPTFCSSCAAVDLDEIQNNYADTRASGGAVAATQHASLWFEACNFASNRADAALGDDIDADMPDVFRLENVSFATSVRPVSVNVVTGCEQYPCELGQSCVYTDYSLSCTACRGTTVGLNGLACTVCQPGFEPSGDRTECVQCIGNKVSKFGTACELCVSGSIAAADKTQCDQIVVGAMLTSPDALNDIINGTTFLQPVLRIEADVNDAVLVDGSVAQDLFFEQAAADLAASVGVELADVTAIGVYRVAPDGRRRVQSSGAQIEFEITPAVAETVLVELTAQLAGGPSFAPSLQISYAETKIFQHTASYL